MTRDEVLTIVKEHLAEELELDAENILETSRFKEDLSADSLDLYTLLQELEDTRGITIPEEEALQIETVGQAVEAVLRHLPSNL